MSAVKYKRSRVLAFLLAVITLLSVIPIAPVNAETLSDGKAKTVTIALNESFHILETKGGTRLQGHSWTYTTDNGITGPAYCINWGLKRPAKNKKIAISGKYTATPQTLGAFSNGYPQRSLEDFIKINKNDHPILIGLTKEEYASATQIAVWTTLGQLAIDGTEYTSGRDSLVIPTTDPSQLRTYEALMVILYNASFWTKPLKSGMHIRLGRKEPGNVLNIEDAYGLAGAEQNGSYGIRRESINGVEYYTRTFVASSATSTYKNEYLIYLYAENAPEGTILTDSDNKVLNSHVENEIKYWHVPSVEDDKTTMNENGSEYAGDFKVCIPVRNTPKNGNISLHASSVIAQYDIYLANNTDNSEQSFVIADPQYAPMSCTGIMKWGYRHLSLRKTCRKQDRRYGKSPAGCNIQVNWFKR